MDEVPLELLITFGGAVGTTRAISPAGVRFVTRHALAIGERIAGTIRFPPGLDLAAIELRYVARVAGIALPAWGGGVFEVRARFEQLGFAAPGG